MNVPMSTRVEFLEQLFGEGVVRLTTRPRLDVSDQAEVGRVLARAYAGYRLSIPGPPIDFDPAAAQAAADLVWLAAWFLVVRDEPPAAVEAALGILPRPDRQPSQHLSVDLTLRYLPQIYQRARTIAPDDVLTRTLAQVLRHWPLTGVLADLHEPPLLPIDRLEHPGLLLLYAERLAQHPRPEWTPGDGLARQWVERVSSER